MSKVAWKGGALLGPLPPVMVSCGNGETDNIITVAWTGITCTHPPKTYISIRPSRHSYPIIRETGEFVINLAPASLVRSVDYCGIFTGAKVDKFEKCGLTRAPAQAVKCPLIAEAPLSLECRVTDVIPLGSHDMFLADIVAVDVEESLLDERGALCLSRAELVAFAHGEYFALGDKLGKFGFSAAKKKPHPPRGKGGRPVPQKRKDHGGKT
ncbi:MAG: flavin reductase family protein [Clostridia bacterium]|nr:flavin reductase family protein [Clostridia bacterium]